MLRMRHWAVKAAAQKALSVLPGGQFGNGLFQRYVTRSLEWRDEEFQKSLAHCRKHLENYWTMAASRGSAFAALELGSIRRTLHAFRNYLESGDLAKALPWMDQARARFLVSWAQDSHQCSTEALLRPLQIYPLVADARKLDFDSGSVDFFFSNSVLEDIRGQVLRSIVKEFARLASNHSVMSHHIYMGDTLASFDSSITVYNFLRFSPAQWLLINNSVHNQNRLRISDYRRIHEDTGWNMIREDTLYGSRGDLRKVPLAKEFQGYSEQDLLAVRTWLVSSRA